MRSTWSIGYSTPPATSSKLGNDMPCLNCKDLRRKHHASDKCLWGPTFYLVPGRWTRPAETYRNGYNQRIWSCGHCGVPGTFISKREITDTERTHCKACEAMNLITLPRKGET
jgi:hypothetical protein